jgi:hypothetical protein
MTFPSISEKIEILFCVYCKLQSHQNLIMTTTAAAAAYDNAVTEMYGLPRMEDAELEVPFNADTPRPSLLHAADADADADADAAGDTANASFYMTFAQAAKMSATIMKRRRSLKESTHYYIAASSVVQKAFQKLSTKDEMPPADFNLLKRAMDRYRVRLIVSDQMSAAELKTLLINTRFEEQAAEHATYEAFRTNTATDADPAADAAAIEIDAIKYSEAREKYNDLKYWRETLVKEEMRVTPMVAVAGYGNIKPIPNVPTQHAQIAPTSGKFLHNILKPETLRRKFVSLKVLTENISREVAHFLTDADRYADRKCVVKQIAASLSSSSLHAAKPHSATPNLAASPLESNAS